MSYKYIFGPVPSRRLGISLGVDLVMHKTCNLNCVYCECGETEKHSTERKEYVNADEVITEVKAVLATGMHLDYITFSGAGEPTLNKELGKIISEIKELTQTKVAVITNGTLLSNKEVQDDLMNADVIMPSLDSATEEGFVKLNKPAKGLKIEKIIDGIADFRKVYTGEIWLEVFIVEGINDSKREIIAMISAINKIKPNVVQLNSLDRPPAEGWVKKASIETLEKIQEELTEMTGAKVEIITKYRERTMIKNYTENSEKLILNMIEKRPCTIEDISSVTGLEKQEINKYIDVLEKDGQVKSIIGDRGVFVRKL